MAELKFKTKNSIVTLKAGNGDTGPRMEVWEGSNILAYFDMNYIWDFISDIFMENKPKNNNGCLKHGYRRRYNQVIAAVSLGELLANPDTEQNTMRKVLEIAGIPSVEVY